MSQENVELARQAYEALNRTDLEWWLDHITEDFEFHPRLGFADMASVFRGKEGCSRFVQMWEEAWEHSTVRVERIEELDDGIVALVTLEGTGRGSGVEVSVRMAHVATITEGRVSKVVSYGSWAEALEAVGLRE
jgi:ketosteroid isomerase-like protein